MIVVQHIIEEIIRQTAANIGGSATGAGLAIKDIISQVVSINTTDSGEREYLGITDTKGTYFYIRLLNNKITETRKAANTKRGSCALEQETRVILRLVAMHHCADSLTWAEIVKNALYNVNLNIKWPYSIMSAKLFPTATNINSWEVYQEETNKTPDTLSSMLKIVALDFELRFDYLYIDKCDKLTQCR